MNKFRAGAGLRTAKCYRPDNQSTWTLRTRYARGAFGEILAQYDDDQLQYWNILAAGGETLGRMDEGDETRYYYLKDHLGSVRVTIDDEGDIVGYDDYYPFGLQMPGRSWNQGNAFDDQKFTGHFLEKEGGLGIYHAGARMYDPEVPRFYGVDAMRSEMPGWNAYHYTFNNPVRFVDPDGNMPDLLTLFNALREVGVKGSLNVTGIATPIAVSVSVSATLTEDSFSVDVTGGFGVGASPLLVDGNVSGSVTLATEPSSDSQITISGWKGFVYGSGSTSTEAAALLLSTQGGGGEGIRKIFNDGSIEGGIGLGGAGLTLQRTETINLLNISFSNNGEVIPTSSNDSIAPADRTATVINIDKNIFNRITNN